MKKSRPDPSTTNRAPRVGERRQFHLTFRLGGLDEQGQFFEEDIVTDNLGNGGGRFSSRRPVKVGATLKIADDRGFISLIQISWTRRDSATGAHQVGFRFIHPIEESRGEFTANGSIE